MGRLRKKPVPPALHCEHPPPRSQLAPQRPSIPLLPTSKLALMLPRLPSACSVRPHPARPARHVSICCYCARVMAAQRCATARHSWLHICRMLRHSATLSPSPRRDMAEGRCSCSTPNVQPHLAVRYLLPANPPPLHCFSPRPPVFRSAFAPHTIVPPTGGTQPLPPNPAPAPPAADATAPAQRQSAPALPGAIRKRWILGKRFVIAIVILGCATFLAANVTAAVHFQKSAEAYRTSLFYSTANDTKKSEEYMALADKEDAVFIKAQPVQRFSEAAVRLGFALLSVFLRCCRYC